jgi:hypothetical protein
MRPTGPIRPSAALERTLLLRGWPRRPWSLGPRNAELAPGEAGSAS